jgi:hypothetical protein
VDATDGIPLLSDGAVIMGSWIDQELAGCEFADARICKRFGVLMQQLSTGLGRTLPLACGDWASTKAAYRFLDNDRVSEADVLAGHFQATRARFAAVDGPILVLHDTTEFSFTRSDTQAIGQTRKVVAGPAKKDGRQRMHTMCGILMHSSLAVTTDGLPLGLVAINRVSPELPAKLVFTDIEITLLEHLIPAKEPIRKKTVGDFLTRLAKLGGYLDRTRDSPPGNMVLWRGMARLTDIHLGYSLAKDVGN